MSCSPCRRRSSAVPFLHIAPPSRSVPLPSLRAAAGPFLRAYPACAPLRGRARLAPARFARLIARARRRTHVSRSFPPGLFSAPAIASLCRKAERRPREPPLSTLIIHHFLSSQAPWRMKYEIFSNFLLKYERRKKVIAIYPFAPAAAIRERVGPLAPAESAQPDKPDFFTASFAGATIRGRGLPMSPRLRPLV